MFLHEAGSNSMFLHEAAFYSNVRNDFYNTYRRNMD